MMTLIQALLNTSRTIVAERTPQKAFMHASSELGELAEELIIAEYGSYKDPGADGIVGEAIDTIISLVDVIYLTHPDVTEEELLEVAEKKLAKWKASEEVRTERNKSM